MPLPVSWSVVTAAVRPTPDEPRPVVGMALGAVQSTYRRSWDLATEGSPIEQGSGESRGKSPHTPANSASTAHLLVKSHSNLMLLFPFPILRMQSRCNTSRISGIVFRNIHFSLLHFEGTEVGSAVEGTILYAHLYSPLHKVKLHSPLLKVKASVYITRPSTVPMRRILMSPRMWLPFSSSRSTPPRSKQRIAFLT